MALVRRAVMISGEADPARTPDGPARHTKSTFCRVCEPSCALLAEMQGDQVVRLLPDRQHPVSQGFACHKGLRFLDIHQDPDRLDQPLRRQVTTTGKRLPGAAFDSLPPDQAVAEIAAQLNEIIERHGADAVAGYIGNPMAFNALGSEALGYFFGQLGTRRLFSSATQDCSNKFAAAEAMFGTSTLHPLPDLARTHYALIFGENPKVSHMSFVSIADPMAEFRHAVSRGAQVWYVNPRRIEAVTPATGDWLPIRPDTDLYLMAALLHEIDALGAFDQQVIQAHGKHIEELRAFIGPWDAATVAPLTGIEASQIRQIAADFAAAPSACVHMSTGVNMGRQGTLCYWLMHMLVFVTGNLDRRGGNLYAPGFYPAAKAGRLTDQPVFFDSEFGPLRHIRGILPGNLLAEMINSEQQPIRALVILAGNPLLSVAGEARLRAAYADLELVVVLDIYRNASGELADYLLPCTDMLEREDVNICGLGMQYRPSVQYSEALVTPRAERRPEWWWLHRLLRAMGRPSLFDQGDRAPGLYQRLERMLGRSGISLDELRQAPHQTRVLPEPEPGRLYSDWLQTEDKRVDCCPPLFTEALEQATGIFAEMVSDYVPAGEQQAAATAGSYQPLQLINLRSHYMHNSWYQNVAALKRPGQQDNPLHINAADAARHELTEHDPIEVQSASGSLRARVRIDDSLRDGVVAMVHGWGNADSHGLSVARRHPGNNVNVLLPSGPGSYEKLSNQAFMTGIPVTLRAIAAVTRLA